MSAIHFKFYATNNDAEYEALINGLKIALEMGVRNLIAKSDSELVVNQVNGGFQARGPQTELYLRCTQRLIGMFKEVRLECVPREKNSNADALAKMGSQQEAVLLGSIPLGIQEIPSIPEVETMRVDEAPKETWMTPILAYIRKGILPEDKFMARRLRYQAARYVIYDEVLYKRGFNQPLLRACDRCQRFANYSSMPATLLTPMASPWPFAMWEIDLIGELPKAKGDIKYAVVAVDYFTKWAEAMPLATIITKKIRYFVFNSIVSMVPVEVGSGSLRRDCYGKKDDEVNQRLHLDLLEETRENSQLRLAAYQQRAARYYNKKVKGQLLKVGDLVLRKVIPNTKNPQHGVFGANWEGPYKIKSILWKGTYHLEDMDGKLVPRAWNAEHLRKYYQ
ncbi:uncharacterized protein LOC141691847 [Apium graveolens]|uniref:uncharacterized protein LOC141691847 n=1 Tax=Apium graveolens TaxID=4045 RepID=UPI003D7A7101